MMDTMTPDTTVSKDEHSSNRALFLIALFVVVMIPFLVHFNLLNAPLQGGELQLMRHDDLLHRPGTAVTAMDRIPGSPFGVVAVGFFWWLGGGDVSTMRTVALLAWIISALLLVQALRLWLRRTDSVAAPLLGGLLYALSPFSVAVLVSLDAWPALFGLVFAVVSWVFFLKATYNDEDVDYLYLVLSCCGLALAAAAHYSLLLLPVFMVITDLVRLSPSGQLRMKPAWTAYFALAGCAVAVGLTMAYSGMAFGSFMPPTGLLFAFAAAVLLVAWLSVKIPATAVHAIILAAMVLVVIGGGVLSFRQAMPYMDPIGTLEQACLEGASQEQLEQLPLQYMEAARHAPDPETEFGYLQEAAMVYNTDRVDKTRRILGQRLLELGRVEQAAQLLEPFLNEAPFDAVGHDAALALARTTDEKEQPGKIADYYAFALRTQELPDGDVMRYGKALMTLGDTKSAVRQFALLPEAPENSETDIFRKQTAMAYNTAQTLLDKAREQMTENPSDPASYVTSAERELLLGNAMRAFYWLELALRRDPEQEKAWELMGVVFARQDQADQFIAQWGDSKPRGDQAWLRLSKQATVFRAWDAALTFANLFVTPETPAAEELLAAFALELRNFDKAQEWLEKATVARPDSPAAWLVLADIAAAMQRPDEARNYLEEAQKRNAPAEELETRRNRLDGVAEAQPPTTPSEPVRSYIQ